MKRRTCRCGMRFIVGVLVLGGLIAMAPQLCVAEDNARDAGRRCSGNPPSSGHQPVNVTPLILQVLQRSIEPVLATDGLIHLAYAAQLTNTDPHPAVITSVVPIDPLADFSPTGNNLIEDEHGRDIAGKIRLFSTAADSVPEDGAPVEPVEKFTSRVPAGNAGLMFFDVTYTDPTQVPKLVAHAIKLASPAGGPETLGLTTPVPVGCVELAILEPPLVGHGWTAAFGCCRLAAYHRDVILGVDGILAMSTQFAIDYIQIGPNNSCCHGPIEVPSSWWGYGTPVLAAAPGVVVTVVNDQPDQQPVGTIKNVPLEHSGGNRIIEDIGGGRFIFYAHLAPGSIPSGVREGARLSPGDPIGRVGNSGASGSPHLHFQVADSPDGATASPLPFVFTSQMLEGRATEDQVELFLKGDPVAIDRTETVRNDQMPARNDVFGYKPVAIASAVSQ